MTLLNGCNIRARQKAAGAAKKAATAIDLLRARRLADLVVVRTARLGVPSRGIGQRPIAPKPCVIADSAGRAVPSAWHPARPMNWPKPSVCGNVCPVCQAGSSPTAAPRLPIWNLAARRRGTRRRSRLDRPPLIENTVPDGSSGAGAGSRSGAPSPPAMGEPPREPTKATSLTNALCLAAALDRLNN
jgi:hypothetical protein